MEQTTIDFKALYHQMRKRLMILSVLRKIVRVMQSIIYTFALAWFAYCFLTTFLFMDNDNINYSTIFGRFALIFIAIYFVMHLGFMLAFKFFTYQERRVMSEIIARLFPEARYNPTGSIDKRTLSHSRLFGTPLSSSGSLINSTGYGALDIPVGNQWMRLADVGVTSANHQDFSSTNSLEVLYQMFIRPLFGARLESTMHSFRGMFGCCQLRHSFRGYVMLLPDHLEDKISYLAQTIQGYKQKYGANFVHLEDPEFEKYFVVYADNEVEARMILTPAMMRKLTGLRKSFSRDLMMSFNGDMFYYASSIPDGFLRPGRKSLSNEHLLEELYHEINFCRNIEQEMS